MMVRLFRLARRERVWRSEKAVKASSPEDDDEELDRKEQ